MSEYHIVCRADEIPAGGARMFVVDDRPLGVFNVEGKFYALANECPHRGASLAHGFVEQGTVACRIHHWRFRICDGRYLDEDRPQYDVPVYETRVHEGQVQVRLLSGKRDFNEAEGGD